MRDNPQTAKLLCVRLDFGMLTRSHCTLICPSDGHLLPEGEEGCSLKLLAGKVFVVSPIFWAVKLPHFCRQYSMLLRRQATGLRYIWMQVILAQYYITFYHSCQYLTKNLCLCYISDTLPLAVAGGFVLQI